MQFTGSRQRCVCVCVEGVGCVGGWGWGGGSNPTHHFTTSFLKGPVVGLNKCPTTAMIRGGGTESHSTHPGGPKENWALCAPANLFTDSSNIPI